MMKLSKIRIWTVAVIALALALGSSSYAKNSPIYPQFQSNGGTAYAAGTKDGGGGGDQVDRAAIDSPKSQDASLVLLPKEDNFSRFESRYTLLDPFSYFILRLDYYVMLIDLKLKELQSQAVHPIRR